MANNRKYIKLSLSTLLLGLLLFLSCDDRNPVSSQGTPVIYDMNLETKNSECEANDASCDNASAYAALNTYDQLEVILSFDTNETDITQLAEKTISFLYEKGSIVTDADGNEEFVASGPSIGYIEFSENNSISAGGETSTSQAKTDSNGYIAGYWKDNGDVGTFKISAQLLNDLGQEVGFSSTIITLQSVDTLIGSVVAGVDQELSENNILGVLDIGEYATYIEAIVYRNTEDFGNPPLPNVLVEFELLDAENAPGYLWPTEALTDENGIARVPYVIFNEAVEDMTVNFTVRIPNAPETCNGNNDCESNVALQISSDIATQDEFSVNNLLVSELTTEIISDNSAINYQTIITARKINALGALVTEPAEINFAVADVIYQNRYSCYNASNVGSGLYENALCTDEYGANACLPEEECLNLQANGGAYLSSSSVLTVDGVAQSTFTVNSEDFNFYGSILVTFDVYLASDPSITERVNLSYEILGNQDPEIDVDELYFYDVPGSLVLPYEVFYDETISVIPEVFVKNNSGVGISNVLVRFELLDERIPEDGNGFCDNGSECNDNDDCILGSCSFSGYCDNGDSCTFGGDACEDESICAKGSYGEIDSGFIYTCCCDDSNTDGVDNDGDGNADEGDECITNCCGASATPTYGYGPYNGSYNEVLNPNNGFVGVRYSSNRDGIDKLRAWIVDPENSNNILYEDMVIINAAASTDATANPTEQVKSLGFNSNLTQDLYDSDNATLSQDGKLDLIMEDDGTYTIEFTAIVRDNGGAYLDNVEVEFEGDGNFGTLSTSSDISGIDTETGEALYSKKGKAVTTLTFNPSSLPDDSGSADYCITATIIDPATGFPLELDDEGLSTAEESLCITAVQKNNILVLQIDGCDFELTSSLNDDFDSDGINDKIVADEDYVEVTFNATVRDSYGAALEGVTVSFQKLSEFGSIASASDITDAGGVASTSVTVTGNQLPDYITDFEVSAAVEDPLTGFSIIIGANNGEWEDCETLTDDVNSDGFYDEGDEFIDSGIVVEENVSIQFFKKEYAQILKVKGMNFNTSQITDDFNGNGIVDLTVVGSESITIDFEAKAIGEFGDNISGVPVQFEIPNDGSSADGLTISTNEAITDEDGIATVSLTINKINITQNPTPFAVTASITNPVTETLIESQTLNTEFFTEEYIISTQEIENLANVASFDLITSLTDDYNNNGTLDLIVTDDSSDDASDVSDEEGAPETPESNNQEVVFTALVTDAAGGVMENVLVQFQKLTEFGNLSSSQVLTEAGEAATILTLNQGLLTGAITDFTIEASIVDPDTGTALVLPDGSSAVKTIDTEFFTQEYVLIQDVEGFSFESDLIEDVNLNGIPDLTILESGTQDSGGDAGDEDGEDAGEDAGADDEEAGTPAITEYVVTFTATVTDSDGAWINGVPVEFVKTSNFGVISVGTALTEDGKASTAITVDESDLASGFADFSIEAKVIDPDTNLPKQLDNGGQALIPLDAEFFTEQYAIIQKIDDLQISTNASESVEDNNSIIYETVITARTIDIYGGLVTDPVMINFRKTYNCDDGSVCIPGDACSDGSNCATTQGGFLEETSVMTNAEGIAETKFIVNSQDFDGTAVLSFDFTISLAESFDEEPVSSDLNLSFLVQGNQEPELDVSEFHFYPDVDTISHSLQTQTPISVIAKNANGVGLSNVLVRFSLLQVRDSNGELNVGQEYTCCGSAASDGDSGGTESFSCADGSSCDPAGDPCADGSECTASSSGGNQNGVAQITYTNIQEGIDRLYAYILDPDDASNVLYDDILFINSIPSCPDCAEQLILTSEDYILPNDSDEESTNVYAFYTDALGNLAPINDIITFSAQQPDEDGNWIDVGSINPQSSFFQDGDVNLNYIPEVLGDFTGDENNNVSIVHGQSTFNMENSSDVAYVIGNYRGLSDTLGIQINSTEASFVEIVPPFPSEIIVQGGGGLESTLLTAEIRDGNGNLVNDPYTVTFEVTEPQLDNVHLNGIPGSITAEETSSNGAASVTLNAGTKPGTVHMRVTVTDCCDGDDDLDSDFELVAEATPVTITTGPPTSAVIGYAFGEASNIGAGLTEMPVSIMLWDAWSNPVSDSTAVYFGLNPPTSAAIIAQAKTGNEKPDVGGAGGGTWPGVAWTTTQYNSAQLFEFPEIVASTTGNVCLNTGFTNRADCEEQGMVWLPINSELDGLCSMPTGTNPEVCDAIDYNCVQNNLDCDLEAPTGFGADPNENGIYWGIALPLTFSSLDNIVSYENVCVDCTLALVPLSDTQYDFQDPDPISPLNTFSVQLRAQLLDAYNVPVEGALVELIINGSQGGPVREAGGCFDAGGNVLLDFTTQETCLDEDETNTWGLGNWIDELTEYGAITLGTDQDGLKYFNVTFNGDECVMTSEDPNEQWECSSPIIQANLLNPNGATSETITIQLNNTIP